MKKLYLVHSKNQVKKLQALLGDDWHVAALGDTLIGITFSDAVVSVSLEKLNEPFARTWWEETILRIDKRGNIIYA